jgi:hypothetical protein
MKDAAVAEEFANRQFDINVENLNENFNLAIEQGRESATFTARTQKENYAELLGNARENAGLRTEGVNQQEGFQTQGASQQGTRAIGQGEAMRAVSGASGRSSEVVKQAQRSQLSRQITGIGEQADLSRTGIATSLSQTEDTASRNLRQNLESISIQQTQFEESAAVSLEQGLEQAELTQFAATYGIPTEGDIAAATTLDLLSTGVDFGSTLLDIYDDPKK